MAAAILAEVAAATGLVRFGARAEAIAEFLFAELRRHGRPVATVVAERPGPAPGPGGRLRLAGRVLHPPGRAHRPGRVARPGVGSGRRPARTVLGRTLPPADSGDRGGLFVTGHDAEALVVRPKDLLDGAVPSASSVGAAALLRLAALSGEARYRLAAERIIELAAPLLTQHPTAVADLVAATALADAGAEVVVVGDRADLWPGAPALAPRRRAGLGGARGYPPVGGPDGRQRPTCAGVHRCLAARGRARRPWACSSTRLEDQDGSPA